MIGKGQGVTTAALAGLLLGNAALFWYNGDVKNEINAVRGDNKALSDWAALPRNESVTLFLRSLVIGDLSADPAEVLAPSGVVVTEWAEKETIPDEQGEMRVLYVKGQGEFAQIISAFGIMGTEKSRVVMNLTGLQKTGSLLAWEAEVRLYRYRGVYAETEFGSHRTDGNGKEPHR